MNNIENEVFLGVFEIQDANRIEASLKKQEILIEQRFNDQTCRTGCSVTVELWGHEKDKVEIRDFMQKEVEKNLKGLDVNFDLVNQVFDPNAEEVICQACGFKFKPSHTECPDCGLVYG